MKITHFKRLFLPQLRGEWPSSAQNCETMLTENSFVKTCRNKYQSRVKEKCGCPQKVVSPAFWDSLKTHTFGMRNDQPLFSVSTHSSFSYLINGSIIVIFCASASLIPAYKSAVPSPLRTKPPLKTTSTRSGRLEAPSKK